MPKLLLLSTILLFVGCCGDKQDMSRELYDAISGGRADFLRDHKRFPEDITQAVEQLENML